MKKIFYLLSMVVAVMTVSSCSNEQEDFFDDSSANRANAEIKNTIEVLSSASNGWIMQYFPGDPETWGGYNMLAKFDTDGKVTVANEVSFADYTETSYYSVKQSAGVMLSFDTYNNLFHVFSDPSAPLAGDQGSGMEGDYDFSVLSATKDKVVLKGRKQGTYLELTPMPTDMTWEDYLKKLTAVKNDMLSLKYTIDVNGKQLVASPYRRTLQVNTTDEDGNAKTITIPYVFCTDGIRTYMPVNVDGVEITGFKYSADGTYEADNGSGVVLKQVAQPLNQLLIGYQWFCYFPDMGTYGQIAWNYFHQGLSAIGDELIYGLIGTFNDRFGFHFASLASDGNTYSGGLNMDVTLIGDDKVTMQFAQSGYGSGAWYYENADMYYALYPFGHNNAKTFTITTDNAKMPSYLILTDNDESRNVIKLSYNVVYFPFLTGE